MPEITKRRGTSIADKPPRTVLDTGLLTSSFPRVPKAPLGSGGAPWDIACNLSDNPGAACNALIFASRKLSVAFCDGITAFCGRLAWSSTNLLYKLLLSFAVAIIDPI